METEVLYDPVQSSIDINPFSLVSAKITIPIFDDYNITNRIFCSTVWFNINGG